MKTTAKECIEEAVQQEGLWAILDLICPYNVGRFPNLSMEEEARLNIKIPVTYSQAKYLTSFDADSPEAETISGLITASIEKNYPRTAKRILGIPYITIDSGFIVDSNGDEVDLDTSLDFNRGLASEILDDPVT